MRPRAWFLVLALGVIAALYEATVATFLPFPWSAWKPVVFLVSFSIVREAPRRALIYAVVCGILLDAFSVGGSSLMLIRLLVLAVVLWIMSERVLTNHSFYAAVALAFFARVLMQILLFAVQGFMRLKNPSVLLSTDWAAIMMTGVWDTVAIGFFFIIHAFVSRRFVTVSPLKQDRYGP
jgi:hypothetical protein